MNIKNTAATLLLMASLHGHMANAKEVVISHSRLQRMSAVEVNYLINQGIVRIEGSNAILDLDGLEGLARSLYSANQGEVANIIRASCRPYGYSPF